MGLITTVLTAKNLKWQVDRRKKPKVIPSDNLPPKGPGKSPEPSGDKEPHKFSEADEALIAKFKSSPINAHADTAEFYDAYRAGIHGFFEGRKQPDWEELIGFFARHSKHAQELNAVGIKEVSRQFAEPILRYGKRAPFVSAIANPGFIDPLRGYLRSSSIRPGAPEHNSLELAMRRAHVLSDKVFEPYEPTIIAKIKSNPAFLKK